VQPTVISLYTGLGGLDFGFEAAGFRTAVAVELDRTCCQTIRINRDWPVINRRHSRGPSSEILGVAGTEEGRGGRLDRRASVPAVLQVWVLGHRGLEPPE